MRPARQPYPNRFPRRPQHQLPLLRQRPPAPNQPRRRSHQRHRARPTASGNPKNTGSLNQPLRPSRQPDSDHRPTQRRIGLRVRQTRAD
nr:hypothetical protein [Neisseria animaloris]